MATTFWVAERSAFLSTAAWAESCCSSSRTRARSASTAGEQPVLPRHLASRLRARPRHSRSRYPRELAVATLGGVGQPRAVGRPGARPDPFRPAPRMVQAERCALCGWDGPDAGLWSGTSSRPRRKATSAPSGDHSGQKSGQARSWGSGVILPVSMSHAYSLGRMLEAGSKATRHSRRLPGAQLWQLAAPSRPAVRFWRVSRLGSQR